jgi:UDP-N-acetylmuramoyl-tripeptide--D-alanyl-D-alanine ligase
MRGMTVLWTSAEIAAATGGAAHGDFAVRGVSFDSREVGRGELFVAMPGETTDGHRFVAAAFARGAAGALVSQPVDGPHIRVLDTAAGLSALAREARRRCDARIVGVTGSVGKTGTKEAIFAALDRLAPGRTHRSVKSYNNHTGVPLSLARMPRESRFGVFEMGMNHAGELAKLTPLVRPHVALVTAIAPAHSAFFSGEEAIADAKGEIFEGLERGGTAVIPFDSPHRDRLADAARPYAARILTFGRGEGADVRACDEGRAADGGRFVTASLGDATLSFTVAPPGAHWVSNALAVLAVVEALGGDRLAAGLALGELAELPGRGARRRIAVVDGDALLIDESYNANPTSMAASLALLGEEEGARRRIAVLGAMRELGEKSDAFHAALAAPVMAAGVDYALLVGDGMAPLADALHGRIEAEHGADAEWAIARLGQILRSGDAILVKGSNSIGLARVVTALADEKIPCSI